MKNWFIYLDQVVQHEFSDSSSAPFWMSENVRNVGFIIRNVRNHKGEGDHDMPVEDDAAEIRIFQTLANWILNQNKKGIIRD